MPGWEKVLEKRGFERYARGCARERVAGGKGGAKWTDDSQCWGQAGGQWSTAGSGSREGGVGEERRS